MLSSTPFLILIGSVLGFLTGLGTGGGSLLILWLTAVADHPQEIARAVNLLFFLPSALISSLFHRRQGTIDLKIALPAALLGCVSAAVFTLLSANIDLQLLKKCFGVLLIVTGLREIFYKRKAGA